jgi:hypothetical protein
VLNNILKHYLPAEQQKLDNDFYSALETHDKQYDKFVSKHYDQEEILNKLDNLIKKIKNNETADKSSLKDEFNKLFKQLTTENQHKALENMSGGKMNLPKTKTNQLRLELMSMYPNITNLTSFSHQSGNTPNGGKKQTRYTKKTASRKRVNKKRASNKKRGTQKRK